MTSGQRVDGRADEFSKACSGRLTGRRARRALTRSRTSATREVSICLGRFWLRDRVVQLSQATGCSAKSGDRVFS